MRRCRSLKASPHGPALAIESDGPAMYVFLDIFFLVFHATLIGFNLTGWLWEKTRRLHLVVLTLTVWSWGGLGVVDGLG